MPLPPEVLRLKRKRHEEPVDLLYIQHEGPQPKKSLTKLNFQFERVPKNNATAPQCTVTNSTSQISPGLHNVPHVPTVRATLPGEENEAAGTHAPQSSTLPIVTHEERPALGQNDSSKESLSHPPLRAEKARLSLRRFHLTPETMAQFHHRRAANIRIHKRDTRRIDSVLVFSERAQAVPTVMEVEQKEQDQIMFDHNTASTKSPNLEAPFSVSNITPIDPSSTRKRPISSAAETKRRQDTQKTRAGTAASTTRQADLSSIQLEYENLKLAFGLQQFAEEQAKTASPNLCLKVQPKPNPRRYNDRMAATTGTASTTAMDLDTPVLPTIIPKTIDSDDDYVIDTYIRKPANPTPSLQHGLLVIRADEEEIWHAYGDSAEEDQDSDSDSEDSNAEDYYANEYPEDEVDEEDEYGRGAYGVIREEGSDEEWDGEEGFIDNDGELLRRVQRLRVGEYRGVAWTGGEGTHGVA